MSKKKEMRLEQHEAYLLQERRKRSKSIQEEYPYVEALTFELQYWDANIERTPDRCSYNHSLTVPAVFHESCPFGCVGGGYDLYSEIHRMLRNREIEHSGTIHCKGWEKGWLFERKCPLRLKYKACHYPELFNLRASKTPSTRV